MTAEREYALSYRDGYTAGQQYARPDDLPTLWRDERGNRSVRGHGRMHPASAAGWMRGFRHGLMDLSS